MQAGLRNEKEEMNNLCNILRWFHFILSVIIYIIYSQFTIIMQLHSFLNTNTSCLMLG